MKKILLSFFSLLLFISPSVFAKVSSFDVKLEPRTVSVGETVDLTIKAIDENGNIDKNYTGKIVVVEGDNTTPEEISFPGFENPEFATYTFTEEDQGVKKFENAISFKKAGKKGVSVGESDLSDNGPIGGDTISVTGNAVEGGEISITSPNDNEIFSKDVVKIVGTTKKNSRIKIKVNDKDEYEVISNSNGTFEKEISGLPDGGNTIQAILLNGEGKEIGKSNLIKIEIKTNGPAFRGITITPKGEVAPGTELHAEVLADAELNTVNLIIDDVVYTLDEKVEGKYEAIFSAPNKAGEYKVDLKLKDDLGNVNNKTGVKIVKVIGEETEETTTQTTTTQTPAVVEEETTTQTGVTCEEAKINGIKLTQLKTKSILAWNKIPDAIGYNLYKKDNNGAYTFFEKVDTNRIIIPIVGKKIKYELFSIKAICKKQGQEIEAKEYSKATKIQTGPLEILLLIIAMISSGIIFFFYRKKS